MRHGGLLEETAGAETGREAEKKTEEEFKEMSQVDHLELRQNKKNLANQMKSQERIKKIFESQADKLKLSQEIREQAFKILEKYLLQFSQGLNHELVCAGSLYYAVKQNCIPYTLSSFSKTVELNGTYVGRFYRKIVTSLEIYTPKTCMIRPTIFVKDYLVKLKAGQKMRRVAFHIDKTLLKRGIHVGTPSGVAAGIIYLAGWITGRNLTQYDVAEATNITTVTIRNRSIGLIDGLGEDYFNPLMKQMEIEPEISDSFRQQLAKRKDLAEKNRKITQERWDAERREEEFRKQYDEKHGRKQ